MAVPKKATVCCPGFHRRAVACAVQPFGQPAYDHHTPLRHCQRKIPAGGKPILCGAAGAHHAHIPPPVQAGRVSGTVQHQRQVGQVPQPLGVIGAVRCQDKNIQIIAALFQPRHLGRGHRLHKFAGFCAQVFRRVPARFYLAIQFGRVRVFFQKSARQAAAGPKRFGQPQPIQCAVHTFIIHL